MKSAILGTLIAAGLAVWPMGRSVHQTLPEPTPAPNPMVESPESFPAVTLDGRHRAPNAKLFKDLRDLARALSLQAGEQAAATAPAGTHRRQVDAILTTLSNLEKRATHLLDWQLESLHRMSVVASFLSEEVDVFAELQRSAAEPAEQKQSLRNIDELSSRIVAYIDAYEDFGRSVERLNQLDESNFDLEDLRRRESGRAPQWASM
jgi:hypothetical protein